MARGISRRSSPSGSSRSRPTYRGWTVSEIPPNTQGIAALMMLELMEPFPLGEWGFHCADALHAMIEAKKLAYADMLRYVGDPRFGAVPVAALLDQRRAAAASEAGRHGTGGPQVAPDRSRRTHRRPRAATRSTSSVIDKDGNIVSLIQSISPGLRLRPGGGGHRLRAAQPRRAVITGARAPERARARQAAAAHDHSGIHAEGRRPHRLRHHGRLQPGAGARAVRRGIADYGLDIQQALEAGRFTKPTFSGLDVVGGGTVAGGTRRGV